METDNTFVDPMDFDLEKRQLARRRQIADELLRSRLQGPSISPQGRFALTAETSPGGQIAAGLDWIVGNIASSNLDQQEKLLAGQELGANRCALAAAGLPEDLATAGAGIRPLLEKQLALKAAQEEKGAQLAADRQFKEQEAEKNRIEWGEQLAADRLARQELRAMPATVIHVGGGGGGGKGGDSAEFAGPMTQVGVIPEGKEGAGNPVYRHTKSGKLFQFDASGEPKAYTAIATAPIPEGGTPGPAIAPKPRAMTAAETKAIHEGNLGIQGVDDALAKVSDPKAKGALGILNAVPGMEVGRQYTGTPEQIAARAAVSNIGSLKLHDRSGAAVTISEFPRLAPFIPKVTDNEATARIKLQNLKDEYARMVAEWSGKPATPTRRKFNPETGRVE